MSDALAPWPEGLPTVALSIIQPWAWLIVHGHKDIENRDWCARFRGRVLIHTGKTAPGEDEMEDLMSGLSPVTGKPIPNFTPPENFFDPPRGGIVGVAEIVDCVSVSRSPWFVGKYGFVLKNAQPLPFRPCRGQPGFFTPDYTPAAPKSPRAPKQKPVSPQGRLL